MWMAFLKICIRIWTMTARGHQAVKGFIWFSIVGVVGVGILGYWFPQVLWIWILILPLVILGFRDLIQTKNAIKKNFPILGNLRYFFESIRPEINQYFVESNLDGRPFSREERSVIYQRAKGVTDTLPFGTQQNVYAENYEWVNHSLDPQPILHEPPRVLIGGKGCTQPYSAALFNISAMSYGSLSRNAILALNGGAKIGGFYHNTGEGGLSHHHLEMGGDIVWQIGTGYFGCRDEHGNFSEDEFLKRAHAPQVKMIEIKLSQGAKPGHGGILPAQKLTPEIAQIRGVVMGKDVLSPPSHSAFKDPNGLVDFVARLRKLSEGKPVGFKLCIGKRREFMAIVKAMLEKQIFPDFITVDGAEGGTGAAPLEFSNSIGTPLNEGLSFVHQILVSAGIREHIKIIASGRVLTGFNLFQKIALGADLCNSARGMMFSLGCIQALKCNTNTCPTGIATQDPALMRGLVVGDKKIRVARYQKATVHSFLEVMSAAGIEHPTKIRPWHVLRRVNPNEVKNYEEIYGVVPKGGLITGEIPHKFKRPWGQASSSSWNAVI